MTGGRRSSWPSSSGGRRRMDWRPGSAAAAETARCQYSLLELIGEFDAMDAIRHWTDVKSLAHWLSWACAMAPGVAREHVRVAKALRRMPTIAQLFKDGRLSYSKVREVTRVVDVVDEQRLAGLAVTATAAQLAKMISGFRSADGMRIAQQTKRSVAWHEREDGMIDVRARLPKEEAAVLIAAIDTARDQFGPPPPKPDPAGEPGEAAPGVGVYSKADALVDVARVFLNTAPQDRSGEDRNLVVCTCRPRVSETFPRERRQLHQVRPSATSPESALSRPPLPRRWPAITRCWVRSLTSTARCWRWVARGALSARGSAAHCLSGIRCVSIRAATRLGIWKRITSSRGRSVAAPTSII